MKFIHAADIHIDRALPGMLNHEGARVDRTPVRTAFTNLIDRAIDEEITFLILAGDIFDGAWRDINTGMFFVREMSRLNEKGIAVYMLRGNHDAANETTRKLPFPPNVHIFRSETPQTFVLELPEVTVALHGQSFKQAEVSENLLANYPPPVAGHVNIGVLHTGLEGLTNEHAAYAPCTVEQLRNKGYDYFALGHIHQFGILCEAPYIVMPGNLQGLHAREPGPRGAVLVTYEDGEWRRPKRLIVDVLRWATVEVDLSAATSREEAVAQAGAAMRNVLDEQADGCPVACRVIFAGHSAAHGALFGREQALRDELAAQAIIVARDKLWIEKVKVETQPLLAAASIASRGDALADLQTLLAKAAHDEEFIAGLQREFQQLLAKLPQPVFEQEAPALAAIKAGSYAELVDDITPSVIARVTQGS